jgi:hypothetical protein
MALLLAAMMAMLSLVIDLGVVMGQRRFAQNGADAAASAVAHVLAGAVQDADDGGVFLAVPDSEALSLARRLAGLDPSPTSFASTQPTSLYGNPAIAGRTHLSLSLEYWDGGHWCYSPSGAPPPSAGGPPTDCGSSRYLGIYPPRPAEHRHYRVRATVNVATVTFFPALGEGNAACVRPAGAAGVLTCASATYIIGGPCPPCTVALQT